ncbi:HD domain-containing protein [Hahella sp. KA22]|nr:HD domain-containing protein [Hahella sp. KA22]QAY55372.1 HD domain-containing protein [Hahella sp. KA22]
MADNNSVRFAPLKIKYRTAGSTGKILGNTKDDFDFLTSFFSSTSSTTSPEVTLQQAAEIAANPVTQEYLSGLLWDLDGVRQPVRYHPEEDALYHSLQVFELAYAETGDPELWAAALFHDLGKSVDQRDHCAVGAAMVRGVLSSRVEWLIAHHLDLLISPQRTRRRLGDSARLQDLIRLRRWDLGGRSLTAKVRNPEQALQLTLDALIAAGAQQP